MVNFVRRWLPLALVALAALGVRLVGLGDRPMHADEANQAVKFGALLERGEYRFDPADHHGPTLYYAALLPAWSRGETTLAGLSETTVRLTPAIFGALGVLLVSALARPFGTWPAVAAAACAGLAAPAVYYSRYFIQETLLVTFTLAAWWCGQQWWRRRRLGWAAATGASTGLMLATKESAVLLVLVTVAAVAVARPPGPERGRRWWHTAVAGLVALAVAALLYSSLLANPAGPGEAVAAVARGFNRATGGETGHEKPWWYYLSLFLFGRGTTWGWGREFFLALTVGGLFTAYWRPSARLRFAAAYTVLLAVAISLAPYKTPWIAVNLVPGCALLAAGFLAALVQKPPAGRVLAIGLGAATVAALAGQTRFAVFTSPTGGRNPLAYVHSSPDVRKVPALAQRAGAGPIKAIGEEYWPLPWYLRAAPHVGYWNTAPADCDAALIFATQAQAGTVRARLHGRYREDLLGLREGVLLVVFTRAP